MKKIHTFTLIMLVLILSACKPATPPTTTPDDSAMNNPVSSDDPPSPPNNDYLPNPADSKLSRGNAYLDSIELLTQESYPVQFSLMLKGNTPTSCNQLRIAANPPDTKNKIIVDVYSVVDPNVMCAEALQSFEVNFPLGSFPTGHYTLWVNGEQISEFDS